MTTTILRTLLLVDILAMAVVALVYLRQRQISGLAFFGWSLLAMLVPLLGPFLVIACRPGSFRPEPLRSDRLRRRPAASKFTLRYEHRIFGRKGKLQ
jgi:hypothetical protein